MCNPLMAKSEETIFYKKLECLILNFKQLDISVHFTADALNGAFYFSFSRKNFDAIKILS